MKKYSGLNKITLFDIFIAVALIIVGILVLYPLIFVLSASISDPVEVNGGNVVLFPKGLQFDGYKEVFKSKWIMIGYRNSLFYTIVGTMLNLICTLMAGYVLSRRDLFGRKMWNWYIAIPMWFSGGLIPTFLLIRNLGMFNTRWALLIPGMLNVWNMIVCRTYINSTIPDEMFEAASIDGCGYFRFWFRMVLPLSAAIIAVLTLWYAIGHWNSYFNALVYVYDPKKQPLQLYLRSLLVTEMAADFSDVDVVTESLGIQELMKNSMILIACLPLWILYPFVQRYFVEGVMIGSVKG